MNYSSKAFLNQISMSNKISSKVCTSCKISKELSEFYKNKSQKDGLRYECKTCDKERKLNYRRTKIGLVTHIYNQQRASSKKRGHKPPNYTKQELTYWLFSQLNFEKLYKDWVNSDYDKKLIPSCDRDNDYLPYDLSRLTLTTWDKNNQKGNYDRVNGINSKVSKSVIGTHIKTGEAIEFHSMKNASRNGFNQSNISACCRGKQKTHYGYTWSFVD